MNSADLVILLLLILLLSLALGLALVGGGLLLRPPRASDHGSDPPPLQWLDRQWRIERGIYRHHRLAGLLVIAAALLFFFKTWPVGLLAAPQMPEGWLLGWWVLAIGNLFNLLVGILLLLRPSRLRPLEAASNRWIAVKPAAIAAWLLRHPRLRGALILLISLICATGFAAFTWIRLQT